MALLNPKQFKRSEKDPTATVERKIQKALRNMKSKLPETEYKNLYPTGLIPGKLYGTAKVHKMKMNGIIRILANQLY